MKHFLKLSDLSIDQLYEVLNMAKLLKKNPISDDMKGRTLGLLFEKPSTRTRVSFESGFYQLGGNCVVITPQTSQISRGETLSDTARVLSRYLDMIVIRTFGHKRIEDFALNSSIPVINGLTDITHPCQVLADLLTIQEKIDKNFKNIKVAYFGDGNNMANSWIKAASLFGFHLSIATPVDFSPSAALFYDAVRHGDKDNIEITDNPLKAAADADVLYTDVWQSMGEKDNDAKMSALSDYQINDNLSRLAQPNFLFMHCLPAHIGEEVSESVYKGTHSVVYDEAENRLHAQKALMVMLSKLNLEEI